VQPWINGGMKEPNSCSIGDTPDGLTRAEVLAEFSRVFSLQPPPRMSLDLANRNLAWASQAVDSGRDPVQLRHRLLNTLESAVKVSKSRRATTAGPGARLIREWRGKTYEVTVLEDGYLFQSKHYRSLTEIAVEITGTRWSGPRFFGLQSGGRGRK
jgi:hypothetical protein